jgi:hypothetical protein
MMEIPVLVGYDSLIMCSRSGACRKNEPVGLGGKPSCSRKFSLGARRSDGAMDGCGIWICDCHNVI